MTQKFLPLNPRVRSWAKPFLAGSRCPCADVVVPCGEVEIFLDNVMIEAVIPSHCVRGDELFGIGIGANDVQLVLLITAPGVADKSLPGQQQAGISVLRLDRDLAPVENRFAPVGSGPAGVQIIECAVSRLEPLLELRFGIRIERDVGIFVVDLPAQYVRIVAETLGQLFGDLARKFPILGIGEVELLPIAMFQAVAFFIDAQGLGIFLGEPSRRSRSRCANRRYKSRALRRR